MPNAHLDQPHPIISRYYCIITQLHYSYKLIPIDENCSSTPLEFKELQHSDLQFGVQN